MSEYPHRQDHQHYVVTGAGTGIGRAIAHRLAAEGAQLTLMARDPARLEATAAQISQAGGLRPAVVMADIRDQGSVDMAFAKALAVHVDDA